VILAARRSALWQGFFINPDFAIDADEER